MNKTYCTFFFNPFNPSSSAIWLNSHIVINGAEFSSDILLLTTGLLTQRVSRILLSLMNVLGEISVRFDFEKDYITFETLDIVYIYFLYFKNNSRWKSQVWVLLWNAIKPPGCSFTLWSLFTNFLLFRIFSELKKTNGQNEPSWRLIENRYQEKCLERHLRGQGVTLNMILPPPCFTGSNPSISTLGVIIKV